MILEKGNWHFKPSLSTHFQENTHSQLDRYKDVKTTICQSLFMYPYWDAPTFWSKRNRMYKPLNQIESHALLRKTSAVPKIPLMWYLNISQDSDYNHLYIIPNVFLISSNGKHFPPPVGRTVKVQPYTYITFVRQTSLTVDLLKCEVNSVKEVSDPGSPRFHTLIHLHNIGTLRAPRSTVSPSTPFWSLHHWIQQWLHSWAYRTHALFVMLNICRAPLVAWSLVSVL